MGIPAAVSCSSRQPPAGTRLTRAGCSQFACLCLVAVSACYYFLPSLLEIVLHPHCVLGASASTLASRSIWPPPHRCSSYCHILRYRPSQVGSFDALLYIPLVHFMCPAVVVHSAKTSAFVCVRNLQAFGFCIPSSVVLLACLRLTVRLPVLSFGFNHGRCSSNVISHSSG